MLFVGFNIFPQNNLYQHFASSQVGQNANKKQKVASKILTALWIQLLLVLSFFADGAQALIKVNGEIHFLLILIKRLHKTVEMAK